MTKDEILSMAIEAGLHWNQWSACFKVDVNVSANSVLERFATLVAAKAAEDERAACASLCEEREDYRGEHACAILERGAP